MKSRRKNGSREWRRVKPSAASVSRNPPPPPPISDPTPAVCEPTPSATGTTGSSTAPRWWITNGSIADVAVVWARTDDGVRGFVVPTDTPGFSAPEIKNKMSLRASVTSELVLEDVRLPASAMLPKARGLSGPLGCLNEARFGIIFGAMGAARDCLETAISYARDRKVFDKSLAAYQITQAKIADMAVELGKGQLLAIPPRAPQGRRDGSPRAGQHRQAQQCPRGHQDRP